MVKFAFRLLMQMSKMCVSSTYLNICNHNYITLCGGVSHTKIHIFFRFAALGYDDFYTGAMKFGIGVCSMRPREPDADNKVYLIEY